MPTWTTLLPHPHILDLCDVMPKSKPRSSATCLPRPLGRPLFAVIFNWFNDPGFPLGGPVVMAIFDRFNDPGFPLGLMPPVAHYYFPGIMEKTSKFVENVETYGENIEDFVKFARAMEINLHSPCTKAPRQSRQMW